MFLLILYYEIVSWLALTCFVCCASSFLQEVLPVHKNYEWEEVVIIDSKITDTTINKNKNNT